VVVDRLATLHERLDGLSRDPGEELAPSRVARKLFRELGEEIASLQEAVEGLVSNTAENRLASLATRIAVHFFIEDSMPRFCERVLDELIDDVGAGSGALILFDSETSDAKVIAARDAGRQNLDPERLRVSRTILSKIVEGEDSVLVEDALSDAMLRDEESVQQLNLHSILAIPLRFQDYLAGAIHLENEQAAGAFGEEDRALLLGIGRLITIYLNAAFRLGEEVAARRRIYQELKGKTHFDGIVGSSPRLRHVLETVAQVGPSDATVIIEGASGTGKELVARALHLSSQRAGKPMVVVNCAAIPENLLESELFGHERGAFTGAFERKVGRFEQANGGTLFLDEIGELPPMLQAKLLRFLQNRELERLGSTKTIKVDVRLVAATNRDIWAMVQRGDFREELYFRLYVVPIKVPTLSDRAEDIPLLVDHFSRIFALQGGREPPEIDSDVYECLQNYSWPGNVRELENLMQRLVVLCRGGHIGTQDLPERLIPSVAKATFEIEKNPFSRFLGTLPMSYEELKRRRDEMHHIASAYAHKLEDKFIDSILEKAGGNVSRAAQEAGIHRTLIHRNLRTRSPRDS
jgi:transcriptional regulator with GAF, ATPase, and Fis domain